jgi:ribosomal protein S27AE
MLHAYCIYEWIKWSKKVNQMNDVEELNKEMDKELENSPALRMAFVQIRALDKALDSVLKQMERGFCPNCGKGLVDRPTEEPPADGSLIKKYLSCPQCARMIRRQ